MATPPDFVAGNVLTAAQMNAVGLWLIKTQTIGSGVSSVTVSDVFSADYENYRIIVSGGVGSTNSTLRLTIGAANTAYYWAAYVSAAYSGGSLSAQQSANSTNFDFAGQFSTDSIRSDIELNQPFLTKNTFYRSSWINPATGGTQATAAGYLNNSTSYTAFTLTCASGTLTGGTVYVYGYRD